MDTRRHEHSVPSSREGVFQTAADGTGESEILEGVGQQHEPSAWADHGATLLSVSAEADSNIAMVAMRDQPEVVWAPEDTLAPYKRAQWFLRMAADGV